MGSRDWYVIEILITEIGNREPSAISPKGWKWPSCYDCEIGSVVHGSGGTHVEY